MGRRLARLVAALLLSLSAHARPATADDLADEAEVRFDLGNSAYGRGDFADALAHYMASNRLVPNKNVVFNIARTYERLGKFPEAYRYYSIVLDSERDKKARARVVAALEKLRHSVGVLDIRTEPPGATIYVDRIDLGPRGEAPRTLGLAAGRYKIIAVKSGYETSEQEVSGVAIGSVTQIALRLRPILGVVEVKGASAGAVVRVADGTFDARCVVPCVLSAPPGLRELSVERPGFLPTTVRVRVVKDERVTIEPTLEAITGALVVSSDEPGALIEVDGRPEGFTPAIVKVPVGRHTVRVTLAGFRPVERSVHVAAGAQRRIDVSLQTREEVVAASRQAESLDDAPSSVSVIPLRELRAFAHPTIAESLRGTRGVYGWDDRAYASLGVRGLGRLGSYGTRLLVLADGHPTNDNWIGSSYVGYDARTDLGDVERIELVRGPGSVLYGSNAFTGVVNLVTRSPTVTSVEAGVGTHLDGVARTRVRGNVVLGKDASIWTSVSTARSRGRDFFFPEYVADTPPDVAGHARGVDGFRSGTVAGRAQYKAITAQWFLHRHDKRLPAGAFETLLGDPRTTQQDDRAFVELRAEPRVGERVTLLSRAYLNHYRFDGAYARDPADGGLGVDRFRGSWAGLEQRLVVEPTPGARFTVGAEGQAHFQVEQESFDEGSGTLLDDTADGGRTFQVGAAYALADVGVSRAVRVSAGARLDAYSTFGQSLSPRVALVTRPYARGVFKVLGGKAFRAPSVYELFYDDGGTTQIASPDLEPESIYSVELEHTHRFSPTVSGSVSSYANYVTNTIGLTGSGTAADPLVYENAAEPIATVGAELEVRREFKQGLMLAASYGVGVARFLRDESSGALFSLERSQTRREVSNAPRHLASLKAAVPVLAKAASLASRLSVEGPRLDRFEDPADPAQGSTRAFALWDLVLTGYESKYSLNWALGMYNAFDARYALPVSGEFRQSRIEQNGRTFLASVDVALH
ncbi:MAG: TonB-dependent receptor [Polyangiaceae bacterium]|nr:TonB-dependent receptor [Polyangiaceae bacterium]